MQAEVRAEWAAARMKNGSGTLWEEETIDLTNSRVLSSSERRSSSKHQPRGGTHWCHFPFILSPSFFHSLCLIFSLYWTWLLSELRYALGGSRLFKQVRPPTAAHCVFVTSASTEQHVWESQVREREWEGGGEEETPTVSWLTGTQRKSLLVLLCRASQGWCAGN